jgi:hypothetical protein
MARYIALDFVFFLLPFVIYAVWLIFTRGSMLNMPDWEVRTVAYLSIAGAAVLLVAVFAFTSFNQAPPEGVYVPAHIEDGKVVPGHIDVPPAP